MSHCQLSVTGGISASSSVISASAGELSPSIHRPRCVSGSEQRTRKVEYSNCRFRWCTTSTRSARM